MNKATIIHLARVIEVMFGNFFEGFFEGTYSQKSVRCSIKIDVELMFENLFRGRFPQKSDVQLSNAENEVAS